MKSFPKRFKPIRCRAQQVLRGITVALPPERSDSPAGAVVAAPQLLDGVREQRPRTATPSRHPPGDPGRLTISVRPASPATPRESTAVGHAVRRAVRADRLGDARHRRSITRAVTSGVSRWARARCHRW